MSKRFILEISNEEEVILEDYRIQHGFRSRAAAIRNLIEQIKDTVPKSDTFNRIAASLEQAKRYAAGEEVPGLVVHKIQVGPSTQSPGARLKQERKKK